MWGIIFVNLKIKVNTWLKISDGRVFLMRENQGKTCISFKYPCFQKLFSYNLQKLNFLLTLFFYKAEAIFCSLSNKMRINLPIFFSLVTSIRYNIGKILYELQRYEVAIYYFFFLSQEKNKSSNLFPQDH